MTKGNKPRSVAEAKKNFSSAMEAASVANYIKERPLSCAAAAAALGAAAAVSGGRAFSFPLRAIETLSLCANIIGKKQKGAG